MPPSRASPAPTCRCPTPSRSSRSPSRTSRRSSRLCGRCSEQASVPQSRSAPASASPSDRFFELSLDPLVTAGFDGYIKRTNRACERLLGWTEGELQAVPYVEFIHPDDRDRTVAEASRLASPGAETRDFEIRVRRRDGAYRVWLFSATGAPEQGLIYAVA